jgi:hypothetical protein
MEYTCFYLDVKCTTTSPRAFRRRIMKRRNPTRSVTPIDAGAAAQVIWTVMTPLRVLRRSRAVAVVLLLAALHGLPHLAPDDALCAPTATFAAEHDETQHGLRAAAPLDQEHCAVCHWLRSLRAPGAALAVAVARVTPPTLVARSAASLHRAPVRDGLPARAPPTVLI